ncbi:MAG: ATP-dependent Clp protease ATP-binding subunit, partial [Planctomycetes bacterium]|nr:ATP-dependent Clp protease ATP-binding subunit [Planctomycetota bacterium]
QRPDNDATYDSMKERVTEHIERVFRPEFLNRLDDVIVFRHLTTEDLKAVIDMELASVRGRLKERGFQLRLTDDAKEFLIREGCKGLEYGARPLRRAIESRVEDPLSEELLRGEFQGKDEIVVDAVWDENHEKITRLCFEGRIVPSPQALTPAAQAIGSGTRESSPEPPVKKPI